MQDFECKHNYFNDDFESSWTGSVETLFEYCEFDEIRIKGRGSSFLVILGYCSLGNYLCIPQIDVGCALSSLSDVFYNTEKLTPLIGETDAVTVATALFYYDCN